MSDEDRRKEFFLSKGLTETGSPKPLLPEPWEYIRANDSWRNKETGVELDAWRLKQPGAAEYVAEKVSRGWRR